MRKYILAMLTAALLVGAVSSAQAHCTAPGGCGSAWALTRVKQHIADSCRAWNNSLAGTTCVRTSNTAWWSLTRLTNFYEHSVWGWGWYRYSIQLPYGCRTVNVYLRAAVSKHSGITYRKATSTVNGPACP